MSPRAESRVARIELSCCKRRARRSALSFSACWRRISDCAAAAFALSASRARAAVARAPLPSLSQLLLSGVPHPARRPELPASCVQLPPLLVQLACELVRPADGRLRPRRGGVLRRQHRHELWLHEPQRLPELQ